LFVGTTAGATFAGALQIAREAPAGSTILCMLPDTGERYLSTPLFADIPEEMTAEETALSRSTPGYRFDVPGVAAPAPPDAPVDAVAMQEVQAAIMDAAQPVVMFALEWCEFCWSARKLFARYQIPYRSIDVDSAAFQQDDRGGKLRRALKERTGWNTLPQIFIGGEFVGGCTDLFDEGINGKLRSRLAASGIELQEEVRDPYGFLPKWLHRRGA
jgi:cysteine synthase A